MRLKALIFDVDGTLADTEEVHRCAFNAAFRELGLDWNWSRPKYAHLLTTTGGKERLIAYIESLQLTPIERQTLVNRVGIIHGIKTNIYTRMVSAGQAPLRDGVARLMDEAQRADIRLAIASTTTYENIETMLRTHLGADAIERFAVIGAGDVVKAKKPSPAIYEFVMQRLGVPAGACVAIEDSANGLKAAKAAGLYTIVTPSYWTSTEDFSSADLVLPSLGSTERPLTPRAAALVGHSVLGIREIDRQLTTLRECG